MRRRRPATASSSLAPGKQAPVDHHLAGLGDGVVPAAASDLADVGGRGAEQVMGLVAEVGGVQGEHHRGGVLDGRHALPRPAAVARTAADDHVGDQQAPLGDADRQRGRLGDQAGVALDEAALGEDPGAERAAPFLVGDEVEDHVARRPPARSGPGRRGRRSPPRSPLHVRAAPPVEAAVGDHRVERRATPEVGLDRDDVEMAVDDQGRPGRRPVGMGHAGQQGQPPVRRLDLGDRRPVGRQGLAAHPGHGPFVAWRIAGVDGHQGLGQRNQFTGVHVGPHWTSLRRPTSGARSSGDGVAAGRAPPDRPPGR